MAAATAQEGTESAGSLVRRGFALHQAGRYDEALPLLRRALTQSPQDYFANLLAGIDLLRTGRNAEAIPFLREAAKQRPNEEFPYEYLGEAEAGLKDFAAAVSAYQHAVATAPSSPDAATASVGFHLARFADLASELRRTQSGLSYSYRLQAISTPVNTSRIELLRRAASLDDDAVGIWSELAIAQFLGGDFAAADESAKRAMRKNPNDLRAWQAAAMLAARNANWHDATMKLEQISEHSPGALAVASQDWPQSLMPPDDVALSRRTKLFFACVKAGGDKCQPEVLRKELPASPDTSYASQTALYQAQHWEAVAGLLPPPKQDALAWLRRGMALAHLGDCAQALPILERAITGTGRESAAQAQFFLSVCYASESGAISARLQEAAGETPALHMMRGDVLLRLRADAAGALTEYQAARRMDARNPAIWERLAAAQLANGQPDAARASAESALRLDPARLSATRTLAKIAMNERDYPHAAEYLRQIVQRDPADVSAKVDLANACAQTGALEEALRNLAPALASGYPDEKGSLHYLLGTVLRRLGRQDESKRAFAKSRELSQRFENSSHEEQSANPREP